MKPRCKPREIRLCSQGSSFRPFHVSEIICPFPFVILGNFSSGENSDSYFALSCSSLIMSVLLYCNDPKEHAKFLETMMRFKKNVCLDLLAVMAYGPTEVLQPSVQLLFHYYPSIDVGAYDSHFNTFDRASRLNDLRARNYKSHPLSEEIIGRNNPTIYYNSPAMAIL